VHPGSSGTESDPALSVTGPIFACQQVVRAVVTGAATQWPHAASGGRTAVDAVTVMAVTTLMFPIGHCLGTCYLGSADDHVQQVRLGGEILELSDHEFAVWALAHGLAEVAAPWDRASMEAASADSEISDAPELIDRLLSRSLLAEVDVDSPAAADFARRHRLLPLHIGLGNSAALSTMFATGTTEQPLVGMTRVLYDLWLWGHLAPNLMAACEEQSTADEPDPHRLLAQALTTLHALLAPSAACLDVAVPEYQS
jgi:hypothetical protein